MGKRAGASDHLVALLRVNTHPHRDGDRLVKLGGGHLLEDGKGVAQWVLAALLDESVGGLVAFAAFVLHVVLQFKRPPRVGSLLRLVVESRVSLF
jgi:hypothetical protein